VKDPDAAVVRFMQLFRCNERSYGTLKPPKWGGLTVKGHPIPPEAYRAHLEGEIGLGGVPILDDGTCWWAAIDFDTHGPKGRDFNIFELAAKIEKFRYPLILCRSKSGGAHAYVFFAEPTSCAAVRPLLSRWAQVLGWAEVEIFPKQSNLDPVLGEKELPLGNWLNLPYFNVKQTKRYCVSGGKEASLEYFLELAEGGRYRLEADQAAHSNEYAVGPPCIQEMIKNRVDEGNRNNAVFQAAVFLKRFSAEDWKQKLSEFNALALTTPLGHKELRQITGSVNRRDYNYKCREEPCKSLCNREVCRTREFGITDGDTRANELPPFDKIEKVIATPIRWVLWIKGQQIELESSALFDFSRVRVAVYEKLNILLPRMKSDEWDVHLREVAERAKIRHETTLDDVIFQKMCDFVRRAHQDRQVPEDQRREALLRKMPALISISNTQFKPRGQVDEKGHLDEVGRVWYYAFRAQDFIDYMRRHKALIVQEHQVHTILHRVLDNDDTGDCMRDRFRVGERTLRNVWCVPEQVVSSESVPEKKFSAEF
jgi:hypothetical protein